MYNVPCTCQTTQRPTDTITPPGELNQTATAGRLIYSHLLRLGIGRSPHTAFSPRLRDDIDQRRFAAFNGGDRAPERRPKILWIRDGSVGIHAQSL